MVRIQVPNELGMSFKPIFTNKETKDANTELKIA